MKVFLTRDFKKIYKKRILPNERLKKRFHERYDFFVADRTNPVLKDHNLKGDLEGHRAFSITGDIRVIYYIHKDVAYFLDIGTHNQVYK